MARYNYKARDPQDRVLTGVMDGSSVDDIIERLSQKNLTPVSIDELNFDGTQKGMSFWDKLNAGLVQMQNKVPYRDVVFFTRQLATMIDGGVPLVRSLEQLGKSEKPVFKKIITQMTADIGMGYSFSDAISRHPGAFNNMFVSVVRSGEVAGALDKVLEQMATYMENVEAMKSKVKSAMRYPIFIGGFVVVLVTGILWKLVPVFEGLYGGFGAKLPLPTQVLIFLSHLIQERFIFVALGVILLIVGYKMGMTRDGFKYWMHKMILRIPVFGDILLKNLLATFSRTMALLMESGTPILETVEICAAVVGNRVYADALKAVYENLKQGELLSQALEKTKKFPVLVIQLVATGEESGKIDTLLRKVADFYEREIKNTVDSIAAIIEPFLIIILGGIVGGILIALYLPVFMVGKLIGGS